MNDKTTHFVSPKLEAYPCPEKGEYTVLAKEFIPAGELLVMWGGAIVPGAIFFQLSPRKQMHAVQVEEDLYQVPYGHPEPGDYINHCCNPNAGLTSPITLVAMRDIYPDEEVCFDYAMSDATPYDEFECACGAKNCRGQITGNDWMLPELQERYAGYFSPYIQRRIERQRIEELENNFA